MFGTKGIIVAFVLTASFAYLNGWQHSSNWTERRHSEAVADLNSRLSVANKNTYSMAVKLAQSREVRLKLRGELKDEAIKADGANNIALPASSVRRIFSRGGGN
jgi:hypothetical protein